MFQNPLVDWNLNKRSSIKDFKDINVFKEKSKELQIKTV